ncbi:hypothetical protein KKG72_09490 [bacterium]|nr:hypothetical protein [bacterium]MBU1993117.1 hypothetical protein [bacterium]
MPHLQKKFIYLFLFFSLASARSDSLFQTKYSFSNLSINYLSWTQATQERSFQKSFAYLEFEGGVGFEWGNVYMFTDIENPTHTENETPMNDRRYVFKPVLDVQIAKSNWYLYAQDYNLYSQSYYVSNFIAGISYKIQTDALLFQPFLAPHYQQSTYYSGMNGYMAGWLLNYKFKKNSENMSVSQWHEMEFARVKEHYLASDGSPVGDGKSYGIQGALSVWWHPSEDFTSGIQYRYALYKLGYNGYQDGFIYTLKYNF